MSILDYSLCDQTVTIYRKKGEDVTRQILGNCYFSGQHNTPTETYGKSQEKKFRLIIPGDTPILCGDRIYEGIGPAEVEWETFVPAAVPALYEVRFAKPCHFMGEITHWEAGAERRTF